MAKHRIYLYEWLFLLNQQAVASDFSGCVDFIRDIFDRAEADLLVIRRWDERRLAYPIKGQRRGTFILTYFRARGSQIPNIDRDCNLSEQVLRCMMLRADHLGETELAIAAKDAETSLQVAMHNRDDDHHGGNDDRPASRSHEGATATATAAPAPPPAPTTDTLQSPADQTEQSKDSQPAPETTA